MPESSPFTQTLSEYIRACFTGIWVQSHEHEEVIREFNQLCREREWLFARWDLERGLQLPGTPTDSPLNTASQDVDPLSAVRAISQLAETYRLQMPEEHRDFATTVLVLTNFHKFLNNPEILQALIHQLHQGKQQRAILVILAPVVTLPIELERQFVVVEHPLPDSASLEQIIRETATESDELPDDGESLGRVLDAARGFTRQEAENACSLSLVRHGRVEPDILWDLKTRSLTQSGLLELHRGAEQFDQLGGLDSVKSFCRRALQRRDDGISPRGIMLLSPPGCGKSQFCKALGNETGRPTLILDVGKLMGSLVGQTEERTRQALQIADAMAPCILMVDEIEKALSGVQSSGRNDSGVSSRLFGSLLTWLNDHQSDVFFIATCNDISMLPPEFTRAERFDGVFFIDLPGESEREQIWRIHLAAYGLDTEQQRPADEQWTGAEIKACCRLSRLLDVSLEEAAMQVVPIARTSREKIEQLRQWAQGRCLNAQSPGIYTTPAPGTPGSVPGTPGSHPGLPSEASAKEGTARSTRRSRRLRLVEPRADSSSNNSDN